MIIAGSLLGLVLSAGVPDSGLSAEASAFVSQIPPDFSKRHIQAMEKAQKGENEALNRIRFNRPDIPPPDSVRVLNTIWDGVPVRLYLPEKGRGKSLQTVIYLHGGGWVIGNVKSCSRFCGLLCSESESIVVVPDYSLAPEAPYPAALVEVMNILKKVMKEDIQLPEGFSAGNEVYLAGDSAGGNLAIAAALKHVDETGQNVSGTILFYPVTDVTDQSSLSMKYYGSGYALDSDIMKSFTDCYLPQDSVLRMSRYVSPLRSDLSNFPRTLLIVSQFDILRDQGRAFAERLKQLKRPITFREYSGAVHLFITVSGMDSAFRKALKESVWFLKSSRQDRTRGWSSGASQGAKPLQQPVL